MPLNFDIIRFLRVLLCSVACLIATHASAAPPTDAIESVQQRVVKIYGAGGIANLHAYGTGFLVSPDGHIATVWSHVLDGDVVTVVLDDGRRFYGKVLGAEPRLDLALVKIDGADLPCFDLKTAAIAGPGTRVLGFSNMFKVAAGDEPVSVVHGVVTALTQLTARRGRFEVPYTGPVYIVDAVTNNPGAAGGVLTNYDGQLLGMLGRELRNADSNTWINYVIPIAELAPTIDAIRTGDFSSRDNPPEDANPLNYSALDFGIVLIPDVIYRTPAYIDSVQPESQAETAGLQSDDLIVFLNNQLVPSIRILESQLGRLQAEDDAVLIVRRGNQLLSVLLRARGRRNETAQRFRFPNPLYLNSCRHRTPGGNGACMTQIILEGGIVDELLRLNESVELCDSSGRVLGKFHPQLEVSSKLPEGFKSPFSKAELDAASRDPRRYTTEQVLQHLKNL